MMSRKSDEDAALKERISKVFDGAKLSDWRSYNKCIEFRVGTPGEITLQQIIALSVEFGTDKINFSFGYSGQEGYSDWTPSSDGGPGYIQVFLP